MSWNQEKEKKLRELWKKGHSASQIASMLGDTTRNAVIGKAHRLNLEARNTSRRSEPRANKPKNNNPEIKPQKIGRKAKFKALLLDKNFEEENPTKFENLNPSLEPCHAFAEAIKIAPKLNKETIIIVNSCGDAKKDRDILKQRLKK